MCLWWWRNISTTSGSVMVFNSFVQQWALLAQRKSTLQAVDAQTSGRRSVWFACDGICWQKEKRRISSFYIKPNRMMQQIQNITATFISVHPYPLPFHSWFDPFISSSILLILCVRLHFNIFLICLLCDHLSHLSIVFVTCHQVQEANQAKISSLIIYWFLIPILLPILQEAPMYTSMYISFIYTYMRGSIFNRREIKDKLSEAAGRR